MTSRTRYFVIASLLVLTVGLGTGLLAYYAGGAPSATLTASDLQLVPPGAQLIASVDVREILSSDLGRRLYASLPLTGAGTRELFDRTGINIETDVDRVVACLAPTREGGGGQNGPFAVVRGTFDTARIEGLMREQGATVELYHGARLIVAPIGGPGRTAPDAAASSPASDRMAVAFVEPGLAVLGAESLVRGALDRKAGGGPASDLVMRAKAADGEIWAAGRFDELTSRAGLPSGIAAQIPPISVLTLTAHIDSGIHGALGAEARDPEAAGNLREVIRGLVALAKLQAGADPDVKGLVDSLTLAGSGTLVTMGFDVPGPLVDHLGSVIGAAGGQALPAASAGK